MKPSLKLILMLLGLATGRADLCLSLRHMAEMYKLDALHVVCEHFDYFVPIERLNKPKVQLFINLIKRSRDLIVDYQGYQATENIGEVNFV